MLLSKMLSCVHSWHASIQLRMHQGTGWGQLLCTKTTKTCSLRLKRSSNLGECRYCRKCWNPFPKNFFRSKTTSLSIHNSTDAQLNVKKCFITLHKFAFLLQLKKIFDPSLHIKRFPAKRLPIKRARGVSKSKFHPRCCFSTTENETRRKAV